MTLPMPQDVLGPSFTAFLLPFVFTFAIVYGLLIKANIFGDVNKKISAVLALVIAFFVAAVGGPQMAAFFALLFGGATTFIAGILVIIMFLVLVKGEHFLFGNLIVVAALVVIGVVLFLVSVGAVSGFRLDQTTAALIFWAVVILAIIYYITYEPKAAAAKTG